VAAYKKDMKRIRQAMKEGKLPDLIRELYAPKTMGADPSGAKNRAR
jgi:queuine/archaeosine tRNA-ribosyltransferase